MRYLITALLLSFTACVDSQISEPTAHSTAEQETARQTGCAQACRVELGLCDDTADRQLIQDCAADCPFSAAEVRCLGQLACGDDASTCD